jgi:putative transposase
MRKRREKGIWQRRYWEHQIRDQSDYDLHEHLIIHAPVTAGLVTQPSDWALSSLHVRGVGKTRIAEPPPVILGREHSAEATLF